MSVSAFGSVAPRDPRRPERGRTMERRHGFRVLCPSWRDGQQPPGRPRDQHARAAPDSELHGLHQHVDDSETTGAAALAREADTPRLRCADPADLGTRESVWPIRSRHEYAIGVAVIEMAPGDTTVGSTPCKTGNYLRMTGRYLRMAELSLRWKRLATVRCKEASMATTLKLLPGSTIRSLRDSSGLSEPCQ